MQAMPTRTAASLRVQAAFHFEERKQEVKELRERIEMLRLKRLAEQEERRRQNFPAPAVSVAADSVSKTNSGSGTNSSARYKV